MAQSDPPWKQTMSSMEIGKSIIKCLLVFYCLYYVASSICFACYKLDHFDGRIPFNFQTWIYLPDCCSKYSPEETVHFISMMISFAVCGLVLGALMRQRVWDYALTITVLHILLSFLVMLDFPSKWSWWVCIAFAMLLMITCGQLVALSLKLTLRRKVGALPFNPAKHSDFLIRKWSLAPPVPNQ